MSRECYLIHFNEITLRSTLLENISSLNLLPSIHSCFGTSFIHCFCHVSACHVAIYTCWIYYKIMPKLICHPFSNKMPSLGTKSAILFANRVVKTRGKIWFSNAHEHTDLSQHVHAFALQTYCGFCIQMNFMIYYCTNKLVSVQILQLGFFALFASHWIMVMKRNCHGRQLCGIFSIFHASIVRSRAKVVVEMCSKCSTANIDRKKNYHKNPPLTSVDIVVPHVSARFVDIVNSTSNNLMRIIVAFFS